MANNANYPVWPGWETVRLIGRGSFGSVYEIERTIGKTTERSALKVIAIPKENSEIKELSLKGYDKASITERFQGLKESIEGEYATMAKLKGCANVVYCDDIRTVQHDDGIGWDICIRMELLTPLLEYGKSGLEEREIVRLGKEMCSALVMCQKHDIVHRDIKPQNIFVSNDGTFKLGDFGIAKAVEHTTSGTMTGTYDYMAPEVEKRLPYNRTVDIYSLGMVLYWYLNEKRLPFLPMPPNTITYTDEELAKEKRLHGDALPPPAHGSAELKRIVLKACAYDPKERYQSAEEMLRDLEALNMPSGPRRFTPPAEMPAQQPDPVEPEKTEPTDGGTVGVFGGEAAEDPEADDDRTVRVFGRKGPDISGASPIKKKPWGLIMGIAAALALLLIAFFSIHSWKPATCTEPETCRICGRTRGEALGHRYTEATCLEAAVCTVCGDVSTGAVGHDWGEPVYEWSNDCSMVTAKRICRHDASHKEEETVRTSSVVTVPATCTAKGKTTYTAVFTNSAFGTQTKAAEDIAPIGHDWGEPVYEWSNDCSMVTAKRICRHDASHKEEETVRTSSVVTVPATCTAKGKTTYTAVFANSAFGTQKTILDDIPANGHTWQSATYDAPKTCSVCGATEGAPLTPEPSPTPRPAPEPSVSSASSAPSKTPSEEDLRAIRDDVKFPNKIVYPQKNSYLSAYETMYVKSSKGHSIYLYWSPNAKNEYKRNHFVYEAAEVTVLARENGMSCIIFYNDAGAPISGWVVSSNLVYNYD